MLTKKGIFFVLFRALNSFSMILLLKNCLHYITYNGVILFSNLKKLFMHQIITEQQKSYVSERKKTHRYRCRRGH